MSVPAIGSFWLMLDDYPAFGPYESRHDAVQAAIAIPLQLTIAEVVAIDDDEGPE